jgi:hypothetical protein
LGRSSKDLSALVARSSSEVPAETTSPHATGTTTPSSDGASTLPTNFLDGTLGQTVNLVSRSPGKGAGIKNLAAMRARSTVEENSVTESLTTKEELQPQNDLSAQPSTTADRIERDAET